jgi:hypothetical protein
MMMSVRNLLHEGGLSGGPSNLMNCGLDLSKEQSGRNFGHNLHAEEVNQRISSTPMCYPYPHDNGP